MKNQFLCPPRSRLIRPFALSLMMGGSPSALAEGPASRGAMANTMINLDDPKQMLDRLEQLAQKPLNHINEIADIWGMWKPRKNTLDVAQQMRFESAILEIRSQFSKSDPDLNRRVFGIVLDVTIVKREAVPAANLRGEGTRAVLPSLGPFMTPLPAGGSFTTVPELNFQVPTQFTSFFPDPRTALELHRAIVGRASDQLRNARTDLQNYNTRIATLSNLKEEQLAGMFGINPDAQGLEKAKQMRDLLQKGDALRALWLGRSSKSTLSLRFMDDVNKAYAQVAYNRPEFIGAIGGNWDFAKASTKSGRSVVLSADLLVQLMSYRVYKPELADGPDGFILQYSPAESESKFAVTPQAGLKTAIGLRRELEKFWFRIELSRPDPNLVKISAPEAPANLIGTLEVGYEDTSGHHKIAHMPMYYYAVAAANQLGEIRAQAGYALGVGSIPVKGGGKVPVAIFVDVDWWARQNPQFDRPLFARFGVTLGDFGKTGTSARETAGQVKVAAIFGRRGLSLDRALDEADRLAQGMEIAGVGVEATIRGKKVSSSIGGFLTFERVRVAGAGQEKTEWAPAGGLMGSIRF